MKANLTLTQRVHAALNKLTKWRSVFAGWQLGSLSIEDETCRAVRDHREVTMLLRAEVNALQQLLVAKGVCTQSEWLQQLVEEAEHLDKAYERKFPGFRTSDDGVTIHNPQLAADTTRHWRP